MWCPVCLDDRCDNGDRCDPSVLRRRKARRKGFRLVGDMDPPDYWEGDPLVG